MIRRGTWTPLLPPASRAVAVGVVPLVLICTGADYLLPGEIPPSLTVVEAAAPLEAWGALCLLAGLLMLGGFRMRWPRITIAGGWLGGAVLLTLAVGQLVAVAAHPWWDGMRTPVITAAVGVASWSMAIGYASQLGSRE
jgi:hypothetical protein